MDDAERRARCRAVRIQVAGKNDFRGHVFGCGHHFFAPWDTLRTKISSCGICAIINVEAPLGGCSKTPGKASDLGGVQKHKTPGETWVVFKNTREGTRNKALNLGAESE